MAETNHERITSKVQAQQICLILSSKVSEFWQRIQIQDFL